MKWNRVRLLGISLGLFLLMPISVFAELTPELNASHDQNQIQQKIEALRQLKTENPELYRQTIEKKKSELRSKIQLIKKEQPGQFQQLKEVQKQRFKEYWQKEKTERPEQFQGRVRRGVQRLEQMKQRQPEKFQQLLNQHPRFQEKWNQRASLSLRGSHKTDEAISQSESRLLRSPRSLVMTDKSVKENRNPQQLNAQKTVEGQRRLFPLEKNGLVEKRSEAVRPYLENHQSEFTRRRANLENQSIKPRESVKGSRELQKPSHSSNINHPAGQPLRRGMQQSMQGGQRQGVKPNIQGGQRQGPQQQAMPMNQQRDRRRD